MSLEMKSTQLGGIANLALIADVKPGFIPGAETFTYAERLEALFKTLNGIRLASRESARSKNPFPDALGRWGILHSFRYAVIPPEIGDGSVASEVGDPPRVGNYRLYLSVTFDGGWEPYIRVIYRDLGSLLDTIFTNCIDYPLSRDCSFDTYTRWVRSREIPAGIFYTESAKSVLDQRYLEEVERIQREEADPERARKAIATLWMKPPPDVQESLAAFGRADPQAQEETVYNNTRALKALFDLRAYYAEDQDGDILRRFAVGALPEFRALLTLYGSKDIFAQVPAGLKKWLLPDLPAVTPQETPRSPAGTSANEVQLGILSPYKDVTHGVLFLLAVVKIDKAREYLRELRISTEGQRPLAQGGMYCNVAFTRQGLEAFHASTDCLDQLPQEFIEGMESRAGMLGDVRTNHPDRWRRPRYKDAEVDLRSVHVVLQYRLADKATPDGDLHAKFESIRDELAAHEGFRLLSTEPMRSSPTPDGHSVEHFGFKDGFSQPTVAEVPPARTKWHDLVPRGELLLGHPNDRGDGPYPPVANPYLDNGSFLVLRKISQDVAKWKRMLRRAASDLDTHFEHRSQAEQDAAVRRVAAKMVGRDNDGIPAANPSLGAINDFNYDQDALGTGCPFQSHVRRANPRRAVKTPRLSRRGMSYGPIFDGAPGVERGLYFMAYCASIAEQFEVVQRWIAGGNSSGVLATHSDPMLGVPQIGVVRSFQWLDEDSKVARVDLGDEPLTKLEWGLYLFAPARTGLKQLVTPPAASRAPKVPKSDPPQPVQWEPYQPWGKAFDERRALLQDREKRDLIWKAVNDAGGQVQTAYGLLVGKPDEALRILKDHGSSYSVWGYGRRFEETIGMGFLGLDPNDGDKHGHTELAEKSGVKKHVSEITEELAFGAACEETRKLLARFAPGEPGSGRETAVDILDLHERALAALCFRWFGLPDESFMLTGTSATPILDSVKDLPCCPRDFVHVARHIFGAHPTDDERRRAKERGDAIRTQVSKYLVAPGTTLVDLSAKIAAALKGQPSNVIAQTISGVILGFAPSVHGNYTNVMRAWVEHKAADTVSLWDLQTRLLDLDAKDRTGFVAAERVLRPELIKQMSRALVPPAVWREAPCPAGMSKTAKADIGSSPPKEPAKVIVGLHGVMQEEPSEVMMFGGAVRGGPPNLANYETDHACPGRGMAIGVLLGVISTLLLAGTLRSTPSYTLIKIVR